MKTFQPKLEVRLIKTARREVVGLDVPAAKRYASLDAIDLTPYLADSTPVRLGKSVRDASGGWSLMLVDKPVPGTMETLYALIEPMDIIEFRLAHSPFEYRGKSGVNKYKLPVVMRGFVSVIARTRSMVGGRPMRTISLSGHDFGKILEILRIYYLNNSAIGDNIIGELKFFHKYAGLGEAKIMSCADFVALVLDKVLNPYLNRLTTDANGDRVESKVINAITAEVSIKGTVSPIAVSVFEDGSVHQFLSQILDVGAFNEMFLEERDDSVVLVVRPNPFMDVKNKLIQTSISAEDPPQPSDDKAALKKDRADVLAQHDAELKTASNLTAAANDDLKKMQSARKSGNTVEEQSYRSSALAKIDQSNAAVERAKILTEKFGVLDEQIKAVPTIIEKGTITIDAIDVETVTESRSDGSVANYYWTTNTGWQIINNQTMRQLADASMPSQYAPFDYVNCEASRYGFRKMEVEVRTGPPTQEYPDAVTAEKKQTEKDKLLDWLVDRRRILAEQNKDNVVFESGEMHIRGNEKIRAGMYLLVNYGDFTVRHYVTHVQHDYQPFVSFKTIVTFERSNGFIERAQRSVAPYLAEQNKKGVV